LEMFLNRFLAGGTPSSRPIFVSIQVSTMSLGCEKLTA
jgi:hypothetical protein